MDKYEQTRKRITQFYNNKSMSDKEIIEYLVDEIEQYREKIKKYIEKELKGIKEEIKTYNKTQKEEIDELKRVGEITSESNIYHCGVDDGTGKDFFVTRWYEDGVLIKEEIRPCSEEQKEDTDENDCPPIPIGYHKAL